MTAHKPRPAGRTRQILTAVALSISLSAFAQTREFSIPEGELAAALEAYVAASGVQLVYRSDEVKGQRSPGVRGSMDAAQALRQLLEGTPLKMKKDASGAFVVFTEAALAEAAESPDGNPSGQAIERITVTGKAISHLGERNRTGTRTDTDPMDLAQSVTTVKRQLIENQQASDLRQILANVAGIATTPGQTATGIQARGFDASILRNGSLYDNSSSRSNLPSFAIESVEVVRGPESIIGGQAAGYGGVVNVQTKTANGQRVREARVRLGSRGLRSLALDVGDLWPDVPSLSLRLVAESERNGRTASGYDGATSDYIAPSLAWEHQPSGTTVLADFGLHRARSPYPNLVFSPVTVTNDLVPPILPVPDAGSRTVEQTGTLTVSQRLGKGWSLRAKAEHVRYESSALLPLAIEGANQYPLLPIWVFEIPGQLTLTDALRAEVLGTLDTGELSHHVLLGADATRNQFKNDRSRFTRSFDFNLLSKTWTDTSADFGFPEPYFELPGDVRRESGLVLQNQWYWGEQWSGLVAARRIDVREFGSGYSKWLPSIGLVHRLSPTISLYANVAKAAKSNSGLLTIDNARLPDEFATSRELGFKTLLSGGHIALTGAAYEILKNNAAVPDFDADPSGQAYRIEPTVRSRGMEFEASGTTGASWEWRLAAATNHTDTAAGERLRSYPKLQLTAYLRHSFTGRAAGWWSSLLLTRMDSAEIGREPRQQVDLGVGYEGGPWSVNAVLKSAASRRLLDTGGETSAIVDQEREVNLAVSLKF